MLSYVVINCYITVNNDCLWLMNNNLQEGESMKVGFDRGIKLEFHGAKVTSDSGLLTYRDLQDALGLFHYFVSISLMNVKECCSDPATSTAPIDKNSCWVLLGTALVVCSCL